MEGGFAPLLELDLEITKPTDARETGDSCFGRVLSHVHQVFDQRTHSTKTFKAENLAVNNLKHPQSAQPPPTPHQKNAMMDMRSVHTEPSRQTLSLTASTRTATSINLNETGKPKVNLLEQLPHLARLSAPVWSPRAPDSCAIVSRR